MLIFHGVFRLETGVGIFVPQGKLIRRDSNNADQHPETPIFYVLGRSDKSGHRYFAENEHKRGADEDRSGFPLFVPKETKVGDLLVIQWVLGTCAGARLATAQELEVAKPTSQPMGAW